MMPVKIECGCGQRFAFDVDPVNGQMPAPVACPACGSDATSAANEIISQQHVPLPMATLAAKPPPPPPTPMARIAATPTHSSPAQTRMLPGQVSREQAAHEAKAKIMWGDPEQEVIVYLRVNGFSTEEAQQIINAAAAERMATVRADGIRKIFYGIGLMCVPVVTLVAMLSIGAISATLMGISGVAGLYGLWVCASGVLMAVAPKSEKGDINDK
ncbi:MAG TPA: hypothetical protein VGN23_03500 [Verrucomicrobiae bacterium]|jgi:hypothetical protein